MICPEPAPPLVQVQEVLEVTRDNLREELVVGEGVEEEKVEPILELQQVLYVNDSVGLLALFIGCLSHQSLTLLSQVPDTIMMK